MLVVMAALWRVVRIATLHCPGDAMKNAGGRISVRSTLGRDFGGAACFATIPAARLGDETVWETRAGRAAHRESGGPTGPAAWL